MSQFVSTSALACGREKPLKPSLIFSPHKQKRFFKKVPSKSLQKKQEQRQRRKEANVPNPEKSVVTRCTITGTMIGAGCAAVLSYFGLVNIESVVATVGLGFIGGGATGLKKQKAVNQSIKRKKWLKNIPTSQND